MTNLLDLFPNPDDLLALEPEELGEVLLGVIPGVSQSSGFLHGDLLAQVTPTSGRGYDRGPKFDRVSMALSEAMSWLETQGLIARNLEQQSHPWFRLTRRATNLRTAADIAAYRMGRTLPAELLQPELADKVRHLFLRGDYDTAVFQAFKEVEMAVRDAGGYEYDLPAVKMMRRAFDPENGPLTDMETVAGEREAVSALFAGAMGHVKNPPSHREVNNDRANAARLITFASYLLDYAAVRTVSR
jgi:uncharacterized protein (TIGR02391 family)